MLSPVRSLKEYIILYYRCSIYVITLLRTQHFYVPVSDIQNPDCHQLAPLKDQSRTPCTTCFHQQERYEQPDPESGVNCTKKK